MQRSRLRAAIAAVLCTAVLSACGGKSTSIPPVAPVHDASHGRSPADVKPAPMVITKKLPSSAMHSVKPAADFAGSGWTQIPGTATQAAAAPDGSLWVLSTDPSGSKDKDIWHYANGTWTNIPGRASQLAPAPDGSLFVINSGGGTYHYSNGSWTALGGGAAAITVANDGSTYVASNDGSYAIWKNSGGTWTFVGGSGNLLAANLDSNTYSVNGGTVGPYGLFVVNSTGGIYYTDGTHPYLRFPGAASSVAPTTGGVYVLAYPVNPNGNAIYYYDYKAGSWKTEPGSGVSVSANDAAIYVVSANGAIYTTPLQSSSPMTASPASLSLSLSPASGGEMQSFTVSGGTKPYTPSATDATAASVSMESDGQTVDVTPLKAGSTTITVTDASQQTLSVPVSAVNFTSYSVNAYNLTIGDFAPDSSGNIWYTTSSSEGAGVGKFIPSSGSSTIYDVPLTNRQYVTPQGIVQGPDGNMWFTDSLAGSVTKMLADGTYTQYPAPDSTNAIVVGPDGNLWYTGAVTNPPAGTQAHGYIGDLSTKGTGTPFGSFAVSPEGITVGHDGNLWFAITDGLYGHDAIGMMTTSGTSTTYPLTNGSGPYAIAARSDDTLWFTEMKSNKIGEITTGGQIHEWSLPTPGSRPTGIAVAADGTVWFAEEATDTIGKISADGSTLTEYQNPYGDYPQQVHIGPDGHVWFSGNGRLTRLDF